jgi:hypothetical protein
VVARCATSGLPSRTSFSVIVSTVLFTLMLLFILLFRVTSQSMSTAAGSRPWLTVWLTSAHPLMTGSSSSTSFEGLNQRFEHVGSIIRCYSSFLNFLKVRDDLFPEELHMDSTEPLLFKTIRKDF